MPQPISLDEIIMDAYKTYKPEELEEYKPTNYDRIMAMSVEELAEFLPTVFDMMCQPTDKCREIVCNHGECTRTTECALKWLQSEAEE